MSFTTDAELLTAGTRFFDLWLMDLVSHFGEWRHPSAVAPAADCAHRSKMAGKARETFERHGWVFESGPLGYRVVDYRRPRLRTGRVPADQHLEVIDGQLSLAEAV